MKVHLVFPPIWLTEIPYLSIPALRAHINGMPGVDAKSLDLNMQLWIHLRSRSSLSDVFAWGNEKVKSLGMIRTREELDTALRLRVLVGQDYEELVRKVHNRLIPPPVLQSCIKMYFKEMIMGQREDDSWQRWLQDREYHDPYMNSISLSELATSAESLLESLSLGETRNPYLWLMPMLYRQLVGTEIPDLVGISITAINQVVPALALSHWLRVERPQCRIVWGGQWVTHVLRQPLDLAPLFGLVDGMVVGEGEIPLASLICKEIQGENWDNVPNLFRRIKGAIAPPVNSFEAPNLDHLPTPNFDGIPLDEFDYPGILPLQTSRGCSWNRCRFCSYVILDPVYKKRAAAKVAEDIKDLKSRYRVDQIAFTDAIMEPPHFISIAEEILRQRISVRWRGFGRFDRRFTASELAKMGSAGCNFIIWGMESGSNRILTLMKKGTNRDIAARNLNDAAKAGIHNRVCLIYGYPTESVEDRDLTLDLLRENMQAIHSMAFSALSVERGTPLADGPEREYLEGLQEATELELELPRSPTAATLSYLHETEQELRSLYLALERRFVNVGA